MFFGSYNHQIDQKGRIRVPFKFKEELGEGYVITRGVNGCLFIMSSATKERYSAQFSNIALTDPEGLKAARWFMAYMFEAEEDNQGRILLPQSARKVCGIEKNIVFVGAGDRIEIWSEEVWNKYLGEDTADNFDEAFMALQRYGV